MSCHEHSKWNPSRWTRTRAKRVRARAREHAALEISLYLGETAAHLFLCWFDETIAAAISRDELHARGVKLLGDTDGNTSAAPRE